MLLKEAVIHRIIKAQHQTGAGTANVKPRTNQLPIDGTLQRTAEDVLRAYAKKVDGYGTFDSDYELYRFPVVLEQYINGKLSFINFSQTTTEFIAKEMSNSSGATGGYALFLRYENQAQDWLLIVMLKLKLRTGINEDTLSLEDTLPFDIDHLHEAARIELGKWQSDTQPYLSFIKKRENGQDVTHYFRNALGCTEYIDSKHHTEQVIKAIDDFCKDQGWTPEQYNEVRNEARRRTYEYFDEKEKNGEEANLMALSAKILDQEPTAFVDYVRENGYKVSETFKPHKTTYTKLHRISGTVGSIRISFDVEDIEQQRIDYDVDSKCLIIRDVPQHLVDKFNEFKVS